MKIINPTDDTLTIKFKGLDYEVGPKGVLSDVPEEVAEYWKEKIHNFISIEKDGVEGVESPEATVDAPVELDKLSRGDLDKLAEEVGLDASEFSNKKELIEALEKLEAGELE